MLLKPRDDGAAPLRWAGEIVDYRGNELRLRLITGKERVIPADQILRINTSFSDAQRAGDELFAAQNYRGALDQYRAALNGDKERRPWVKRQIVAQTIWCYRDLGQYEAAGQAFLQVLLPGDESTQFFECIPLAWMPGVPPESLERAANAWLANSESPAATLLGASHLLSTTKGPAAIERLKRLSTLRDPRIAWLAQAQLWRTTLFQADEAQLLGFLKAIDQCPETLRAGPYYLVGAALAKSRPQDAELALLRVPILYPRERLLASAALLAAGGVLQRSGHEEAAARLYHELVDDYRGLPATAEAEKRLAGPAEAKP